MRLACVLLLCLCTLTACQFWTPPPPVDFKELQTARESVPFTDCSWQTGVTAQFTGALTQLCEKIRLNPAKPLAYLAGFPAWAPLKLPADNYEKYDLENQILLEQIYSTDLSGFTAFAICVHRRKLIATMCARLTGLQSIDKITRSIVDGFYPNAPIFALAVSAVQTGTAKMAVSSVEDRPPVVDAVLEALCALALVPCPQIRYVLGISHDLKDLVATLPFYSVGSPASWGWKGTRISAAGNLLLTMTVIANPPGQSQPKRMTTKWFFKNSFQRSTIRQLCALGGVVLDIISTPPVGYVLQTQTFYPSLGPITSNPFWEDTVNAMYPHETMAPAMFTTVMGNAVDSTTHDTFMCKELWNVSLGLLQVIYTQADSCWITTNAESRGGYVHPNLPTTRRSLLDPEGRLDPSRTIDWTEGRISFDRACSLPLPTRTIWFPSRDAAVFDSTCTVVKTVRALTAADLDNAEFVLKLQARVENMNLSPNPIMFGPPMTTVYEPNYKLRQLPWWWQALVLQA